MKKIIIILIFTAACSQPVTNQSTGADDTSTSSDILNTETKNLVYENEFGELVTQDLSSKKTMVVFWADY